MGASAPVPGIGLLGQANWPLHERTLPQVAGLQVVGCAPVRPLPADAKALWPLCDDPEELIRHAGVQAVVLDVPAGERAYWAGRVTAAGKGLLCPPLTPRPSGEQPGWTVLAPLLFAPWLAGLDALLAACGPLYNYAIQATIPRALHSGAAGEHLDQLVQNCLLLVERYWGPFDAVLGRSRSLASNRPQADWYLALLCGLNGLQGQVHIHALGKEQRLRLAVWGQEGEGVVEEGLQPLMESGLIELYGRWAESLVAGSAVPLGVEEARAGEELFTWLTRSARQEREVMRRERHG